MYRHCTACDTGQPVLNDICLVCGSNVIPNAPIKIGTGILDGKKEIRVGDVIVAPIPDMQKIEAWALAMSELLYTMRSEDSFCTQLSCPTTDTIVPEDFKDKIVDSKEHSNKMKEEIRLNIIHHLTKCPSDYMNESSEYEYQSDVYDFSYVVDSYIEQLYEDTHETKTIWICPDCGSDNVQFKTWTFANTMIAEYPMEDGDCYCKDCESTSLLITTTLKPSAKVIGFQVVGIEETKQEGHIHRTMDASFCVYNLSEANKMILDNQEGKEGWRLLTIWEGDIEEPTMMFEGNPRE
jgi:Zn finger protein HypA/HybF involved in hydrogenase expression